MVSNSVVSSSIPVVLLAFKQAGPSSSSKAQP